MFCDCTRIGSSSRTWALGDDEWSASRPGRCIPEDRTPGTHLIGWVGRRVGPEPAVTISSHTFTIVTELSRLLSISLISVMCIFVVKILTAQTVHTAHTRINYRIVPVTNFTTYLQYGTSGIE